MSELLLSKPIVEKSLPELNKKCLSLKAQGLTPKMRVILVGENPASKLYIKNKKALCDKVGADFELIELPSDTLEENFLLEIKKMNEDNLVTGCFVQLPVPKQLAHIDTVNLIHPDKDIDGFHSNSALALYRNTEKSFIPCTPKGILKLCDYYNIALEGQQIVIIGRSYIVGKPLSLLLSNKNATVTLCHSKTQNLQKITQQADIIISARGEPRYLDQSYLKKDKSQIIIDVGINKDNNDTTCGDADFENIKDLVKAITPVPGGVGPLTVLSLIENLILSTQKILAKG